jgi:redox-sensitive bicupin YhaK (pirin superfamily)
MPIQLSNVISGRASVRPSFSVRSFDLHALGEQASPVVVLDEFRVSRQPFAPHPHAGFSAVTYVFEESQGGLRSRDSFGGDVRVGPGGIVWTQAGRGVMHEELPAQPGLELHGLQLFVNLSAKSKQSAPVVLSLDADQVPVWRSQAGDRVRVIVGSFAGTTSPLAPAEPFDLLDIELQRSLSLPLRPGQNTLIYVRSGEITLRAAERELAVAHSHVIAVRGEGSITLTGAPFTRAIVLGGAAIQEPLFARGPFIMNDSAGVEAATARYHAGEMGQLPPLG